MADLAKYVVRLEAETSKYKRNLDRANRQLDRFKQGQERSLQAVNRQFVRLAASVASFVSVTQGLNKLVSTGRQFDKLSAQLKTATGSSEGAAIAFEEIEDFARRTPFALEQSINGFVKLVNLGLTPSRRALEAYGNTASALGKDLTQFVEAVADASVAEFERLKEFGIKARNEGDTIAFTFRGITTEVGNNAKEIEEFLIGLGETEFAGAMQDRVDSLDGALSNLQDSWDSLFRTLNEGPIGDFIEEQAGRAIEALDRLARNIDVLQGTASPEAQLAEQLADINDEIASTQRQLQNFRSQGIELPQSRLDSFTERLAELRAQAKGTEEALEFFRSQGQDDPLEQFGVGGEGPTGPQSVDSILGTISSDEIKKIEEQQEAFADAQQNMIDFRNKRRENELEALEEEQQAFAAGQMATLELNRQRIEETKALNEEARESFIDLFARNMVQAADSGFDSILKSWARTLQQMAAQAAAAKLFDAFGGTAIGSAVGSFFGGARADGGPVTAGGSFLVGERGPELFTPRTSGNIVPNEAMGGTVINIDARGADAGAAERIKQAAVAEAVALNRAERIEARRRGRP